MAKPILLPPGSSPLHRILLILLAALTTFGCGGDRDEPTGSPPSLVLLLSVDTLRPDRLGCYGNERNISPNIDALAAQSIRFTTACAQATQTLVSHKSIFTSRYPLDLIRETTHADMQSLLGLEDPRQFLVSTFQKVSIAPTMSALRNGGFLTAAFTDGSWIRRFYGFHSGFGEFDDRGGHFAGIIPRVKNWLDQKGAYPAFLFVHAYDVHCPYSSREPYNSRFCDDHESHITLENRCANRLGDPPLFRIDLTETDYRAISDHYDGGVSSADAYVGELIDKLRSLGMYDEALIIVTSDHGESLGEHQRIGHGGLYLEQLLVPLLVKPPLSTGLSPAVIEEPVELIDIMPTIFDMSGLVSPDNIQGRSLLPLMEKKEFKSRPYLIAQTTFSEGRDEISNAGKRAILQPDGALLIHDLALSQLEHFDLAADRLGLQPTAEPRQEAITELLSTLLSFDIGDSGENFLEPESVKMDENLKKELEALGYIGD